VWTTANLHMPTCSLETPQKIAHSRELDADETKVVTETWAYQSGNVEDQSLLECYVLWQIVTDLSGRVLAAFAFCQSTKCLYVFNCFWVRSLWWKKTCVNTALSLPVLLNQQPQLNKYKVCTKYTNPVRHTLVSLRMCSLIILFQFNFYRRHFQL
jgi:hypothetical protein